MTKKEFKKLSDVGGGKTRDEGEQPKRVHNGDKCTRWEGCKDGMVLHKENLANQKTEQKRRALREQRGKKERNG